MAIVVVSNGCTGEKLEDSVAKTSHFVISDVIKTGILPVRCDNTREMEIDG